MCGPFFPLTPRVGLATPALKLRLLPHSGYPPTPATSPLRLPSFVRNVTGTIGRDVRACARGMQPVLGRAACVSVCACAGVVSGQEQAIKSLKAALHEAVAAKTASSSEEAKDLKEQLRDLLRRQHQDEHSRLLDLERRTKVRRSACCGLHGERLWDARGAAAMFMRGPCNAFRDVPLTDLARQHCRSALAWEAVLGADACVFVCAPPRMQRMVCVSFCVLSFRKR
jgi:hypothetical protein